MCVFPTSPENVSNGSDCSSSTTCSEWLSLWATTRKSIGGHFTLTSERCLGLPRGRVGPLQHTNDLALSFLVRTWALDVRTRTSSPTHTLALLCENTSLFTHTFYVYTKYIREYSIPVHLDLRYLVFPYHHVWMTIAGTFRISDQLLLYVLTDKAIEIGPF